MYYIIKKNWLLYHLAKLLNEDTIGKLYYIDKTSLINIS